MLLESKIPGPPQNWRNHRGPTFGLRILPSGLGIQGKSHLNGRRRTTQTHGGGGKCCADGRRPIQNPKVGKKLQQTLKDELVKFLKKNLDVFSWSHEDMPKINRRVIEHNFNVNPTKKSVQQKRRVFTPERNKAIVEKVEKLLTARFIREVYYPKWFTNVVMVNKSNGKWRMCVDFTDLNNAYPKDSFPLLRINQLIDSIVGHELLTFMHAFSGYNQILMKEEDQEKTAFVTSQGLYYYKVMLFRLKNAGTTYQRLVNQMFSKQIRRNIEVYVDDILVKIKETKTHLAGL